MIKWIFPQLKRKRIVVKTILARDHISLKLFKTLVILIHISSKKSYIAMKHWRRLITTCFLLKTSEELVKIYLKTKVLQIPNEEQYTYRTGISVEQIVNEKILVTVFPYAEGAFDFTYRTSAEKLPEGIIVWLMKSLENWRSMASWTGHKIRKLMSEVTRRSWCWVLFCEDWP